MTPKSHCRFLFCVVLQLVFSLLGQLPARYGVCLDREALLKSMTAVLDDGVFCVDASIVGPTRTAQKEKLQQLEFMSFAQRGNPTAPLPQEPGRQKRKQALQAMLQTRKTAPRKLPLLWPLTSLPSASGSPHPLPLTAQSSRPSTVLQRHRYAAQPESSGATPDKDDNCDHNHDQDYCPDRSSAGPSAFVRSLANALADVDEDSYHDDNDNNASELADEDALQSTTMIQILSKQRCCKQWLYCYTRSYIDTARNAVGKAEAVMKTASKDTLATVIDALDAIVRSMPEDPASPVCNNNIFALTYIYSNNLRKLRSFTNHTEVWLATLQQCVMVSESVLLPHIIEVCKTYISTVAHLLLGSQTAPGQSIDGTCPPGLEAVSRLSQHVLDCLMRSSITGPAQELQTRDYFPELPSQSFHLLPSHQYLAAVFGRQRSPHTRSGRSSPDSTYLVGVEHTWRAFEDIPGWLLNDGVKLRRNHATAQYVLGSIYDLLVQSARTFVQDPHKTSPAKKSRIGILSGNTSNTGGMLPTPIPEPVSTAKTIPCMLSFIQEVYALRGSYNGETVDNASAEQRVMLRNPNRLMPLRDKAPSRRVMIINFTHPYICPNTVRPVLHACVKADNLQHKAYHRSQQQ
ncbi:hypothetical protein BC835DRAFT_1308814 [Cytidiella melzeri]|nr:hypothetical protein BC835DRAFT_1308814 [Cytidiella melzeri]